MNAFSLFALGTVFISMFALGMRLDPRRMARETPKTGAILRVVAVALVAVPILAVALGEALHLSHAVYIGLLLVGISPGAPLALRRSQESGGHASFAMWLQVLLAVLAIFAVPAWIWLVDVMYHASADIGIESLARQVGLAQLLPIGLGAAVAARFPARAAALSNPLLRLGAVLVVVAALIVLWHLGGKLLTLGGMPYAASAALTLSALGLGHWAGGPVANMRIASAVLCAMRNPGIALLIASTNRLPAEATIMVLAHVLLTTLLLVIYLKLFGPRSAAGGAGLGATP